MQKHRIYTDIGKDQKITVEIKQEYDILEILSLKFTQEDLYTSFCGDYGVVVGRITVNNGYGVPNARVSIFIPLSDEDVDDPVVSALYPYKNVNDKNSDNYRYNLLPSRKQHGGHTPTGTFFDQIDITTREEVLEVYEKYYKYTVKTNSSGDFMIWGVPLGPQIVHVDVDLSDIGCFSLRPDDFFRLGYGVDQFDTTYSFKSSSDLDSLPQIVSFRKSIEVYPFWGNLEICEIGITRSDFDLSESGVNIQPVAYVIGGTFTEGGKQTINKNCRPRRKMGRKCSLITQSGLVEKIRFTSRIDTNNRPILEEVLPYEDIDEDGSFIFPVEMNMDYLITNEFGENEYSNDPNKGIPTSGIYRFRFSLKNGSVGKKRTVGSYLVPNIKEYLNDTTKSYAWSLNFEDYPQDAQPQILNNINGFYYPQDYFYRFSYNKVYTISSFQQATFKDNFLPRPSFHSIKEILPPEEEDCSDSVNTFPVNFGYRNWTFNLLIAEILLFVEHILNIVKLGFMNTLCRVIITVGCAIDESPIRKVAASFKRFGFDMMESGQKKLYLLSFPDCDECTGSNELSSYPSDQMGESSVPPEYCSVGSLTIQRIPGTTGDTLTNNVNATFTYNFNLSTNGDCANCTDVGFTQTTGFTWDSFVLYQRQYVLLSNRVDSPVVLSGTTTGSTISGSSGGTETFYDSDEIINGNLPYNFTIYYYFTTTGQSSITSCMVNTLPAGVVIPIEDGCNLYDTPYNENNCTLYATDTGNTMNTDIPGFGDNYNETDGANTTYVSAAGRAGCQDIISTVISDLGTHSRCTSSKKGTPDIFYFANGSRSYPLPKEWQGNRVKQTKSGMSEFMDGVFYIVPGSQTNPRLFSILREYRVRKRVTKLFCGGIVNYSFMDNWLSGSFYFFPFKAKKGKYCSNIVRYVQNHDTYYYRSTLYDSSSNTWGLPMSIYSGTSTNTKLRIGRPTTFVDLGPRDEFVKEICTDPSLDVNCSVSRPIGPTSFQDFGEILGLVINYKLDTFDWPNKPFFNIDTFFKNNGFSLGGGFKQSLNGDIIQLISINSEVGIEEFDLQNGKYLGYSYQLLDPECYPQVFKLNTSVWGPTPITLDYDEDGVRQRLCLNQAPHIDYNGDFVNGRLSESAQLVPFYLWDKKGTGFGPYNDDTKDDQSWDYGNIEVQPLQGMSYGYSISGTPNVYADKYLLPPITYTFTGLTISSGNLTNDLPFDVISEVGIDDHANYNNQYPGFTYLFVTAGSQLNPTNGFLYVRYGSAGTDGIVGWEKITWDVNTDFVIKRTQDYYNGNKQILSTPFLFYFGLRPGKTGLDRFIERFGPTGAFQNVD